MKNKKKHESAEELVIQYLKKNKNLFVHYPQLLDELNFPIQLKSSNKIIDINAYRSKKLKEDYDFLKRQMSEFLKAGSSHIVSQQRILRSSLKILNTKIFSKLIDLLTADLPKMLGCDIINCYHTQPTLKHSSISLIDKKVASSYFRDKSQTNLNQNPKGILVFFPNKSKLIKSYILLKINHGIDCFIISMGSKNEEKFTKDQQIDLINYLIKIIEIKLADLN